MNYLLTGDCLVVFFLAFLTSVVLRYIKVSIVTLAEKYIQRPFYLTTNTYLIRVIKLAMNREGAGGKVFRWVTCIEIHLCSMDQLLLIFVIYLVFVKFHPAYLILAYFIIFVIKFVSDLLAFALRPTGLDKLFLKENYCYKKAEGFRQTKSDCE